MTFSAKRMLKKNHITTKFISIAYIQKHFKESHSKLKS